QLSGGERQRVALARALFHDPPILIADEPTGNLDSGTGERVLELIFAEQASRGISLLLVTHDERLAARCQRQLYMDDGQIQADSGLRVPE
ncbi:MAG TPA: ATP-binding cassette domain-containing protein, partial [Planctomycetota bacterium]|nr:ATP-binding cassette domain-containing protein [Planctomycetota bacterium]